MQDTLDEYKGLLRGIALLASPFAAMTLTLYAAFLLFRLTDGEQAAKNLPFLALQAGGGLLLGSLTSVAVIYRRALLAIHCGGVLTTLFLVDCVAEGRYDAHWGWALDRNLPLITWSASLCVAGVVMSQRDIKRDAERQELQEHSVTVEAIVDAGGYEIVP